MGSLSGKYNQKFNILADTAGANDGDILKWDATSQKYINTKNLILEGDIQVKGTYNKHYGCAQISGNDLIAGEWLTTSWYSSNGIATTGSSFTLRAGKTYRVSFSTTCVSFQSNSGYAHFQLADRSTVLKYGTSNRVYPTYGSTNHASNPSVSWIFSNLASDLPLGIYSVAVNQTPDVLTTESWLVIEEL